MNSIVCSHYVPKRHLKRFLNDAGTLFIYHNDFKRIDEISRFKDLRLFGITNFYDFNTDPNSLDSNEKKLETIEEFLGDEIDKYLDGKPYDEQKLIQYISFMDSRSLTNRLIIEKNKPYLEDPAYSKSINPAKEFHQRIIFSSDRFINIYLIKEYILRSITTNDNYELFTSDNPVVRFPRQLLKKIVKNYPSDLPDYPVFICPINPHTAIIAIHKNDYATNQLIDSGFFENPDCYAINALIIGSSIDSVCTSNKLSEYDLQALRDPSHPRTQMLNALKSLRDQSPKRIKQKFLTEIPKKDALK